MQMLLRLSAPSCKKIKVQHLRKQQRLAGRQQPSPAIRKQGGRVECPRGLGPFLIRMDQDQGISLHHSMEVLTTIHLVHKSLEDPTITTRDLQVVVEVVVVVHQTSRDISNNRRIIPKCSRLVLASISRDSIPSRWQGLIRKDFLLILRCIFSNTLLQSALHNPIIKKQRLSKRGHLNSAHLLWNWPSLAWRVLLCIF